MEDQMPPSEKEVLHELILASARISLFGAQIVDVASGWSDTPDWHTVDSDRYKEVCGG
tara:strand:+ start:810 stop:983 length:174 start_codon:yes stop_codon:yes gene_type:complete